MKTKREMNWDVKVIGNNTTAYRLIFPPLGELADGYMAVTPFVPWEETPKRTQDILQKYGVLEKVATPPFPAPMFLAVWTYYASMVEGLKLAGPNLTPESFIKGLEKVNNLDTGGASPNVSFTPKRHVGYFSSLVVKADAKNKRFVTVSPIKDPKTPQD